MGKMTERLFAALAVCCGMLGRGTADAAVPDGILVYSSGTDLKSPSSLKFVVYSGGQQGSIKNLTSTRGKDSRISPDGNYVAFTGGDGVYVCELKENASARKLGSGAHPFWVKKNDGTYIFYSDRSCKCSFGTGRSFLRKINLSTMSFAGDATEVKYNGQSSIMKGGMGVNGTYACTGYPDCTIAKADPNGSVKKIGGGQKCNPSIAPTSNRMMILDDTGHRTIATYTITGSRWAWQPGGTVQNPEWSTDENWCTFVSGDHSGGQVWIGDMKNKKSYKVDGARGTFPHFFKGSARPSLAVSPSQLEFSAEKGGSAPSPKDVTVTVSSGSLSGLQASESAGWLSTSVSGNTVTNTVSISGLNAGDYNTTVSLTASNVEGVSYRVSLTVIEQQVFTSVSISPQNPIVVFGNTQQFTAKAKDQNGNDMVSQPSFTWTASGPGTINASGLFTAGNTEGTATVTAASGGKSASTEATIVDVMPVALKINCGGSSSGEWLGQQYASNGVDYTFEGTVNTSNATDPAPASVYSTVRHQSPTYSIPASVIPNGPYVVRLHFNDARGNVGDRAMNVSIEGDQVLSGYDIVAEAGGQNVAVIEQFSVSVTDGNGMTIALSQGSGNDAFISGIEILGGASDQTPAGVAASQARPGVAAGIRVDSRFGGALNVHVDRPGAHTIHIVAADGRTAARRTGTGNVCHHFCCIAQSGGVYVVRITGSWGTEVRTVMAGGM